MGTPMMACISNNAINLLVPIMLAKDYTSDEKRIVKNVIDRYENSGVFLIERRSGFNRIL